MYTDMEQWNEIRHRVLVEGQSKRSICKEFSLHWETLQKILEHAEPPGYRMQEPRKKRKLEPFLPILEQMLTADRAVHRKQRHTAQRIFDRLRTEHSYQGGITIVRNAVRAWHLRTAEVFVPLSHPPGEAQVDFGEARIILKGQERVVAYFVMSLPYSDAFFCCVFPRECTEAFLEGHRRAIAFIGGVPRRISYDNSRIAVNRPLVTELMRCAYIDGRENILLVGNPGTGKTHLATALAMEACGRGKKVRFWRVTELITQLMEAREERLLSRMKLQLSRLDLLVLDELGYVPASKLGAELLFDVISTAYERTSLIITTNLPFERWVEVLGSERLTGATLDRLTHRCHIIESNGESYRLKDARRRRGEKVPGKAGESKE